MGTLDLFGADSTLADQYITLRVKKIDKELLRQKVGGSSGGWAAFGVEIANMEPKMALDAGVPIIIAQAKKFGIELEVTKSTTPPKDKRGLSEFWPGLFVGGVLGAGSLVLWKGILEPLGRRLIGVVR
jgi:hypothetical protein